MLKTINHDTNLIWNRYRPRVHSKLLFNFHNKNFISNKNKADVNNFSSFYKYKFEFFSSVKLKLKDKIKILNSNEINDFNEDWGEILAITLEKDSNEKFNNYLEYINNKAILLSCSDINRLLSIVYNKNSKILDKIHKYILGNNIQLDSISYNYLILNALQYRGFLPAYNLFLEASIYDITQNLSVIIALYKDLFLLVPEDEREKYYFNLEAHVKKYFNNDVVEMLETLSNELGKKDNVEEYQNEEKILNKIKKKKSKVEIIRNEENPNTIDSFTYLDEKILNSNKNESEKNSDLHSTKQQSDDKNENISIQTTKDMVNELTENLDQNVNSINNNAVNQIKDNNSSNTPLPNQPSNKKILSSKKKEKKSKRDNALDNLFNNGGGILVMTQSFQFSEDDGSESE